MKETAIFQIAGYVESVRMTDQQQVEAYIREWLEKNPDATSEEIAHHFARSVLNIWEAAKKTPPRPCYGISIHLFYASRQARRN